MAIDPEVRNELDKILKKIEEIDSRKTGEVVLPIGASGASSAQVDEVKHEVVLAARKKLQSFGLDLPSVAGTYSYHR